MCPTPMAITSESWCTLTDVYFWFVTQMGHLTSPEECFFVICWLCHSLDCGSFIFNIFVHLVGNIKSARQLRTALKIIVMLTDKHLLNDASNII